MLDPGEIAPDFTAEAHSGHLVRLTDYRGKSTVVLYFYPRDGTPICTQQACGFRDAYEEFVELGAVVIGVSSNSLQRHRAFAASQILPFLLLSDSDGSLRKAYGASNKFGILPCRVTYVIDKQGIIQNAFSALWSGQPHVVEALRAVRALADARPEQADFRP